MDISDRLRSLTATDLAPVVRQALRDPTCWPLHWTSDSPGWNAFSPTTRALHKLSGTARLGNGDEAPWTVVLKVVGDVDWPGFHRPDDPLYWRREPLALSSALLQESDGPFVPVRLLAQQEMAEDEVWLWQECLDDSDPKPSWRADQHAAAAYDLGAFGARWSAEPPSIEDLPWLSRHWLRGWLDYCRFFGAQQAAEATEWWQHPLLAPALPPSTYHRFIQLMADADGLLSVVEALPVTLAHHDAQWRNLFQIQGDPSRPGVRTVAVDWAFAGLAPVGADLGHLIACNVEHWVVPPEEVAAHDRDTTAGYLSGLRDYGWRGDQRVVLLARAASAALQIAPTLAAQVSWLHGEPAMAEGLGSWPQELADKHGLPLPVAVAGWAKIFSYLLDLGDEARTLAAELATE